MADCHRWVIDTTWLATSVYRISTKGIQSHIVKLLRLEPFQGGSGEKPGFMPYLGQRTAGLPIVFPEIGRQCAIAEVLGALDDKITAESRS